MITCSLHLHVSQLVTNLLQYSVVLNDYLVVNNHHRLLSYTRKLIHSDPHLQTINPRNVPKLTVAEEEEAKHAIASFIVRKHGWKINAYLKRRESYLKKKIISQRGLVQAKSSHIRHKIDLQKRREAFELALLRTHKRLEKTKVVTPRRRIFLNAPPGEELKASIAVNHQNLSHLGQHRVPASLFNSKYHRIVYRPNVHPFFFNKIAEEISKAYCNRVRSVGGGRSSHDTTYEDLHVKLIRSTLNMQRLARGRLGRLYAWAVRWLADGFHQSVVLARSEELRSVVRVEKLPSILREMGLSPSNFNLHKLEMEVDVDGSGTVNAGAFQLFWKKQRKRDVEPAEMLEKIRIAKTLRSRENALFKGKPQMFFHRFAVPLDAVDELEIQKGKSEVGAHSGVSLRTSSDSVATGLANDKRLADKSVSSRGTKSLSCGHNMVHRGARLNEEGKLSTTDADSCKTQHRSHGSRLRKPPNQVTSKSSKEPTPTIPDDKYQGRKKQQRSSSRNVSLPGQTGEVRQHSSLRGQRVLKTKPRVAFDDNKGSEVSNTGREPNKTTRKEGSKGPKLTIGLATKLKRSFRAKVRPKRFKQNAEDLEKKRQEAAALKAAKKAVRERILQNRQISALLNDSRRRLRQAVRGLWADKTAALRTVLDVIKSTALQQIEKGRDDRNREDTDHLPSLLKETKQKLNMLVKQKEERRKDTRDKSFLGEAGFRERLEQARKEAEMAGFRPLQDHAREGIQLMSLQEFKREHPDAPSASQARKAKSVANETRRLLQQAPVEAIAQPVKARPQITLLSSEDKQGNSEILSSTAADVKKLDNLISILHER